MDFNPLGHGSELPEQPKFSIDSLPVTESALFYSLYVELISYENHYNIIQNKYKGIATTWIITTFVGIGYVLSGYESGISMSIFLTLMFLTLISAAGIYLLWYLDSGIYFKLIESIFSEVMKLEEKYPILGSYHHNILKLHKMEHDPHTFHGTFYTSFIFFMLSISAICLNIYLYQINFYYFLATIIICGIGWLSFFIHYEKILLINHSQQKKN